MAEFFSHRQGQTTTKSNNSLLLNGIKPPLTQNRALISNNMNNSRRTKSSKYQESVVMMDSGTEDYKMKEGDKSLERRMITCSVLTTADDLQSASNSNNAALLPKR